MNSITSHLDTWSSAIKAKSSAERGGGKKQEFYGIKKLRELILELAVRGLLVPQNSNDEPASDLLKRIARERAKLVEAGITKSEKSLPKISPGEKETGVPSGWDWCRLGSITRIVRGITFPASEKSKTPESGRIACLRTSNVQEQIEWDDLLFIREEFVKRNDQIVLKDDIVMSMANSRELVGKVAIVQTTPSHKTTFGGFLGVIRATIVAPHFVMILLRSPGVKEAMIGSASQTTNIANVSLSKLKPLALPLPPLAEQHRIVAKVDELMALCDQLELRQEDSVRTHGTLVETLLGALTAASERGQFDEAWQRIAFHFDTLFTTESSIDQLKQTILQLAVMGKLVKQDPEDEPGEILLKEVDKQRRAFAETYKFRLQAAEPIGEDLHPFQVPTKWTWSRLSSVFNAVTDGDHLPPPKSDDGVAFLTIGNITTGQLEFAGCRYVPEYYYRALADFRRPRRGDILYTVVGATFGRPALVDSDRPFCVQRHIAILKPSQKVNAEYLMIVLSSPLAYEQATASTTGTAQPTIPLGSLRKFVVPLPPLAEQHRIVAKVDELMTLCDRLKASLKTAQATQLHLADSLVEAAIS